jgi:hypothetical protein
MRDGDSFAKKFGGTSGDADWFRDHHGLTPQASLWQCGNALADIVAETCDYILTSGRT